MQASVRTIALLAITLLAPGSAAATASEARAPLDGFVARLDKRVPALMRTYDVPGVGIALVRAGEIVWAGTYGFADVAARRPLTRDAVYRVESISKPVTAWGVMRLVEQGTIDLDAPVLGYLTDWAFPPTGLPAERITVRHLLGNASGIAPGSFSARYPPGAEVPTLRAYLSDDIHLVREPGAGFEYSNAGFNLLELLVEEVTGERFADYMQREVLAPLAMDGSGFAWSPALDPYIPTGYALHGAPVPVYVYPAHASGGLFATLEDVARFVAAGMADGYRPDHQVLTGAAIAALHEPSAPVAGLFGVVAEFYGLGHFVEHLADGRRAVWHGGQGHGWMTHFHAIPGSGEGIVILANSQRSWPLFSRVLHDWSEWNGFSPVGMSRIAQAIPFVRATIAGLVLVALIQAIRIGREFLGGRRVLAPLAEMPGGWRIAQAIVGATLMAGLVRAAMQDYLFISSVLPVAATGLWLALLAVAVVLLVSACSCVSGLPADPGLPRRVPRFRRP